MSAPFKVLVFSIFVVIVLVLVVLFNFGLLQFTSNATDTSAQVSVSAADVNGNAKRESQSKAKQLSAANADIENGKKLYDSKTCVMCHGADGKSNTPMGKAIMATDLTVEKFKGNNKNLPRFEYILHVIENGVPGTAMTSFKSQMPTEQDRVDLAGYVNSLSPN